MVLVMPLSVEAARLLHDPAQFAAHDVLCYRNTAIFVDRAGNASLAQEIPKMDRLQQKAERERHKVPQNYDIRLDGVPKTHLLLRPLSICGYLEGVGPNKRELLTEVAPPFPPGPLQPGLYPIVTSHSHMLALRAVGPDLTDSGIFLPSESWTGAIQTRDSESLKRAYRDRLMARKGTLMSIGSDSGLEYAQAVYPLSPKEACIVAVAALGEPVEDGQQYMTYHRQVAVRALHILHELGGEYGIQVDPVVTLVQDRVGPYMSFGLSPATVAAIEDFRQREGLDENFAAVRDNPPFYSYDHFNRYRAADVAAAAAYLQEDRKSYVDATLEKQAKAREFWGDHLYVPSEKAIAQTLELAQTLRERDGDIDISTSGPEPTMPPSTTTTHTQDRSGPAAQR